MNEGGLVSCKFSKESEKRLHDLIGTDTAKITSGAQARFTNMYDPIYDRPFHSYTMNTDRYLDDELSKLLEDDRRSGARHHLTTDKVIKEYLLAKNTHDAIMRNL